VVLALAVADQRILRGISSTLSFQFTDSEGEPAEPAGAVQIRVQLADGSDLVPAGTATGGIGAAPRTYALPAVLTLEQLTATWSDVGDGSVHVTIIDVAGGFFFSAGQARAQQASLDNTVSYSAADIVAARLEVESECEEICARAFVPRFRRATLDGTGRSVLPTPDSELRSLRSVSVAGTPWDGLLTNPDFADVLIDAEGFLRLPAALGSWPAGVGNVVVEYEHGRDRPPAELVPAAITRLRSMLNMPKAGIPDRAERFRAADGGTFELSMPGRYQTGIPDVDAVYLRYSRRSPDLV